MLTLVNSESATRASPKQPTKNRWRPSHGPRSVSSVPNDRMISAGTFVSTPLVGSTVRMGLCRNTVNLYVREDRSNGTRVGDPINCRGVSWRSLYWRDWKSLSIRGWKEQWLSNYGPHYTLFFDHHNLTLYGSRSTFGRWLLACDRVLWKYSKQDQNLDPNIGWCKDINGTLPLRMCKTPMKSRMQYTPRQDYHNSALTSIIKPANNKWVPKNIKKALWRAVFKSKRMCGGRDLDRTVVCKI